MRFPSKITPLRKSVVYDMMLLGSCIKQGTRSIPSLLAWAKRRGWSSRKAVQTLELLYAINKVDIDSVTGGVFYVG